MKRKLALISIILLATIVAFAAPLQSHFIQKFLGLSTRLSPRLIAESATTDCSNFELSETGAIMERDVFSQYNSAAGGLGLNSLSGLFKYYKTADKFFVGCAGTNVASGSGGVWSDITATGNTVTAGKYWSASSFVRTGDTEPTLYLFNTSIAQQRWKGSGNLFDTHEAPATNCRFSAAHKARMWASGSESLPYRLYYSSLSDPENWTTTGGSIDLPNLAEAITGIKSWGGYLYIFTETSIYRLQGSTPNDFSLVKTISQVGTVAPLSLQVTDIGIMFLARTGVFAFNGNTSIKVSDKIDPTINAISRSAINKAAGLYDGQKKYWLSYPTSGVTFNNKILIYDILLKEWYIFDDLNISYFERAFGGTDRGELYGGSSLNDGIVWLLQASSGTEIITHDTKTDFKMGVTFNTIFSGTETSPIVELKKDPYVNDIYTKLLLYLDNDVIDSSGGHTLVNNNVTFSDTIKVFGSHSGVFNGSTAYFQAPDSDDWSFGTGNFTIEKWIRFDDLTDDQTIIAQFVDGNNHWLVKKTSAAAGNKLFMEFVIASVDNGNYIMTNAWAGVAIDTWYHLAYVRDGANGLIFINGVSQTLTETVAFADVGNILGASLFIGQQGNPAARQWTEGYIDNVRVSKGIARYTEDFTPAPRPSSGTLHSANLEINASDATLGDISWTESLETNTDIQVTTRTGSTNDTVDWADWENWVSTSTVVMRITGDTSNWWSSDSINFDVEETPDITRPRNVDYYEDYDASTPESIKITVNGAISKDTYMQSTIPTIDLSSYKWLGFWLQAPVTESSVVMGFGEVSGNTATTGTNTIGQVTASTTEPNVWEYHYGPLSSYTSTDIDGITFLEFKYLGDNDGTIYIGDIHAYDFLDDDETITSSANDWIQYRAVLGSPLDSTTPKLTSLSLSYTPSAGDEESSLSSYYYTKYLDFGTPMKNKDYLDLFLEVNASTTDTATIVCDWDIDSGNQSGTINFSIASTRDTVRMEKHFPSSTFGKAIRLKFSNADKANQITIRGVELRYREEKLSN